MVSLVLRDDGLGMTKQDFEERWLTLGTESKLQQSHRPLPPPPIDPNKTRRPITGEKGIGRLSIGVIGPQVLVLTRAKRDVVSSSQGGVKKSGKETREELKATQSRIGSLTKQVVQEIQNTVEQIESELTQLDLGQMDSLQQLLAESKKQAERRGERRNISIIKS